jgi:hypothetical protein
MVTIVGEITIITVILTLIFVVPHVLERNVLPEIANVDASALDEDSSTSSDPVLPRFENLKMSESWKRKPRKS